MATLTVDVVVNAAKAVLGFKKVEDAASGTATRAQSGASKLAGIGKAIATGFAVTKVVEFGKESVNAALEAQQANARLATTFKNAGDASGEAAKHAEDYAESLGKQIGVSPEVIKGGEAILATFHSVSDATGRSAGIFDRATAAAADLAAAGFGTIQTNSVQLGKALEDPTKGLTALTRVGVTFTAQQKAAIAQDLKRHDTLAAQKVILGGVEGQVKGTAAATATAGGKMSVAMEQVQETIGTKLIPIINDAKGLFVDIVNFVSANSGWLGPVAIAIGTVAGAVLVLNTGMKIYNGLAAAAKTITLLWSGVTKAASAAMLFLDMAMDANPVALIIIGVALLIGGLAFLIIKVKAVRQVFVDAFNWIVHNWPLLLAILTGPIGLAVLAITRNFGTIKRLASDAFSWVANAASSAYRAVVGFFSRMAGDIGRAMAGVFSAIIHPFDLAWQWIDANIVGPMKGAFADVGRVFNFLVGSVKAVWNPIARALNSIHISIHIPSNPVTKLAHIAGAGFDWRPPWHLPTFAKGGVFDQATLGIIGEAGREIVTPEGLLRKIVGEAGNVTINVNVPATANPAEVGRHVVNSLRAYVRANGPLPAGLTS